MNVNFNTNCAVKFSAEPVKVVDSEKSDVNPDIKKTVKDEVSFTTKKQPAQISDLRVFFNCLTDEQIKEINSTRMLPKNAKFVSRPQIGSYALANNWFNVTLGTQKLPAGFELKKNFLGFTVVVPEGTSGLLVKNAA